MSSCRGFNTTMMVEEKVLKKERKNLLKPAAAVGLDRGKSGLAQFFWNFEIFLPLLLLFILFHNWILDFGTSFHLPRLSLCFLWIFNST